jgi:hypothetical protein
MLVQQPDTEARPRIGGGKILPQLLKTRPVILAQHTDVGGIHVGQLRIILNAVIPHRQHPYPLNPVQQRFGCLDVNSPGWTVTERFK